MRRSSSTVGASRRPRRAVGSAGNQRNASARRLCRGTREPHLCRRRGRPECTSGLTSAICPCLQHLNRVQVPLLCEASRHMVRHRLLQRDTRVSGTTGRTTVRNSGGRSGWLLIRTGQQQRTERQSSHGRRAEDRGLQTAPNPHWPQFARQAEETRQRAVRTPQDEDDPAHSAWQGSTQRQSDYREYLPLFPEGPRVNAQQFRSLRQGAES